MKRTILFLIAFIIGFHPTAGIHSVNAEQTVPSYAKWGQLAVKTAKEKYPKADIIDYLHIGREDREDGSLEKFKLWVTENGKEFGLYINIKFDPKTDRVININIKKSYN